MPHAEAESWLRRAVGGAPRPLPQGRFPLLLTEARQAGFTHEQLMDVLDCWLGYGYCRIVEHLAPDIAILPAGYAYFYRSP